ASRKGCRSYFLALFAIFFTLVDRANPIAVRRERGPFRAGSGTGYTDLRDRRKSQGFTAFQKEEWLFLPPFLEHRLCRSPGSLDCSLFRLRSENSLGFVFRKCHCR